MHSVVCTLLIDNLCSLAYSHVATLFNTKVIHYCFNLILTLGSLGSVTQYFKNILLSHLPSRMDKRVAPDKEGATDKQCLRRRKTLIPNRGRWSSLSLFRQIPFAGTTAGTQPKCGNGGVSDAVTFKLGDRQSSHPVKNPASILWQVFRGVARCCLPRFQGQLQHLKYQNRI